MTVVVSSCAPYDETGSSLESLNMWDFAMIAIGVGFFAIAITYVKGCELLVKKERAK